MNIEDKGVDALKEAAQAYVYTTKFIGMDVRNVNPYTDHLNAFKAGAEWQKTQQSISEEELKVLSEKQFPYEVINWDIGIQKHSNTLMDICRGSYRIGFKAAQSKKYSLEDIDTWKLGDKIFTDLKNKGAGIGNSSISIISKTLDEYINNLKK